MYENKSEVFQIGSNIFVMSENEIKVFNVTNLIRMHVQKRMPDRNVTMTLGDGNKL